MPTPSPTHQDLAAIRECTAELLAAVNGGDVDGVLGVWASDGVMMPPGHAAVTGHSALQHYFRELFQRGRFTFEFTTSDIEVLGDAAVERVTFTVVVMFTSGGEPVHDSGKGVHLYRRQPDGGWRLFMDIWNSNQRG